MANQSELPDKLIFVPNPSPLNDMALRIDRATDPDLSSLLETP